MRRVHEGVHTLLQFAGTAATLAGTMSSTDNASVPQGACRADLETVQFWSGGHAGTWPEEGKAHLWQSFLEAVDGIRVFPFIAVSFVEGVLVVIFSVVGPCGAVDAARVRLLRDVLEFLAQRVDEMAAGGAAGGGGGGGASRAGEEIAVARRLLHLLRHGCGGAPPGEASDLNVDLLVATSEACVDALRSSRFLMLGPCQATADVATTFRETCSLARACAPCCPGTYDDGIVFDRVRATLGAMHAAADEKPGRRAFTDRRWVLATLQHLKGLEVDVLNAVRAGAAYKFKRVVPPAGTGTEAAVGTEGEAAAGTQAPPATVALERFHVFRSGALVGQVETPMNFTRAPLCQGHGAFLQDVQDYTAGGLLLGSAFKFQRCPSSLVTPPAATYVVNEAACPTDTTLHPVTLVFADSWARAPHSAVVSLGTYRDRQLALRLEGAWSARACVSGLCP